LNQTPYEQVGGDAKVRALVERFYALMDGEPEFSGIRKLHPATLEGSTDKLYMYLSGWLGGPQLFVEKFGHPMLRARHLPYAIGNAERDQWMACMVRAMEECEVPELLRLQLAGAFRKTADWMRNKEG
jgi:hemoglobin